MDATSRRRQPRLKRLRTIIEAAPQHLLHMNTIKEDAGCGTAYCALGWAAMDKGFRRAGLVIRKNGDWYRHQYDVHITSGEPIHDFFGITEEEANNLFALGAMAYDDPHRIKKRSVLSRIDRLLAGKPIRPYAPYA